MSLTDQSGSFPAVLELKVNILSVILSIAKAAVNCEDASNVVLSLAANSEFMSSSESEKSIVRIPANSPKPGGTITPG